VYDKTDFNLLCPGFLPDGGIAAGMNGHLGKPVNIDEVIATIRQFLLLRKLAVLLIIRQASQ
jgi:hypothetical protein